MDESRKELSRLANDNVNSSSLLCDMDSAAQQNSMENNK